MLGFYQLGYHPSTISNSPLSCTLRLACSLSIEQFHSKYLKERRSRDQFRYCAHFSVIDFWTVVMLLLANALLRKLKSERYQCFNLLLLFLWNYWNRSMCVFIGLIRNLIVAALIMPREKLVLAKYLHSMSSSYIRLIIIIVNTFPQVLLFKILLNLNYKLRK